MRWLLICARDNPMCRELLSMFPPRFLIIVGSLIALCSFSLVVKENYPFSHFPMYGDPNPERYFFWLADTDGKPLPVRELTGKSSAQLGKILRTYADKRVKAADVRNRDALPPEEKRGVGEELTAFLRQEAASLKKALPPEVAIMRTDIRYHEGHTTETASVYYSEAQ
jgi:hypothetical protein